MGAGPGSDGPAYYPKCVPSTDSINTPSPTSLIRSFASWLSGAITLYALEGLRGRTMPLGGWITAGVLLLAMALAECSAEKQGRLLVEFTSLAAAALVLSWPFGWHEAWGLKIQAIVLARLTAWLLTAISLLAKGSEGTRLTDRLAVFSLFAFTTLSLWMYMTPTLVGPIDARWYGNVITDFLIQFRSGTFPVFSGETSYAFNGAVHPFRSAPWQFDLAAIVDVVTRHSLQPIAVQHATVILSYVAATLGLYTGLVRLRPSAKFAAFFLAVIYATSTGMTGALVMHDMYMTVTGGPVIVAVLLLSSRAVERPSVGVYSWLGAACAFLWLCHPPLAILGLLLASFIVLGHLAVEGPAEGELPAAMIGALVFAALGAPYFIMTRGLSTGPVFHPFTDIVGPAVGLWLTASGLAQTLRRGNLHWLGLAAAGAACLEYFQPSLVPFVVIATVLVWLLSESAPKNIRDNIRRRPEPWLLCLGLLAALLAESFFPRHDIQNVSVTAEYVRNSSADPGSYFRPLFDRTVDQPGLAVWLLLGVALVLCWTALPTAAVLGAACAVILVVALGIIPRLSLFFWINFPPEFVSIISVAYNLRLLPVLTPVVVTAAFLLIADRPVVAGRRTAAACAFVAVMLAWSLWEHGLMLGKAVAFRLPMNVTREDMSADNIVLQRYSWDLLTVPIFFSNGYMDPLIESRFFGPGPHRDARNGPSTKPVIGPEEIAKAMEGTGAAPIDLVPTVDPRGAEWLYFSPKIIVAPGERKLLRFDFMGRKLDGWLIVRGDHIYHEYVLPNSGTWWGFGSEEPDSSVLPVSNSGPDPVAIEIVYKRTDTSAPVPPETYMRVWTSTYDASRSPIAVEQVTPLRMRVDAPSSGLLETYRSFYPGYQVLVDGEPASAQGSYDGLLDIPLTKGRHEVAIRFKGTGVFVASSWWQLIAWAAVGLAGVLEISRRIRAALGQ